MDHRGNPLSTFLVDQIRRLRRQGVSVRTIAAMVGVARSTVEKYVEGLPVPFPADRPPSPVLDDAGPDDDELMAIARE